MRLPFKRSIVFWVKSSGFGTTLGIRWGLAGFVESYWKLPKLKVC